MIDGTTRRQNDGEVLSGVQRRRRWTPEGPDRGGDVSAGGVVIAHDVDLRQRQNRFRIVLLAMVTLFLIGGMTGILTVLRLWVSAFRPLIEHIMLTRSKPSVRVASTLP